MNVSELAQKMLEWEQKKRELDTLGETIQAAVLELEKTQTVGSVKAAFNRGRKTYNYKEAARDHPKVTDAIVAQFTTTTSTTKTDWLKLCKHMEISKGDTPFTQAQPSASIKLVD